MNTDPTPCASTFSKDPRTWAKHFEPTEIAYGQNAHVIDAQGRDYIDWVSALGANLLGYSNSQFCSRVAAQVWHGAGFSLPHTLEDQVALKLVDLLGNRIDGWGVNNLQVRFGKTGTDVTTMAVRLARAVTGRTRILKCKGHYHGWGDWSIAVTPPAHGIPPGQAEWVKEFTFNDIDSLRAWGNDPEPIAAVIMEQPLEIPFADWYPEVRDFCDTFECLLIMDEVVTGLRYALGGASELYHIEPDLMCYGKALGNGLPISALIGRREYMKWFDRVDPVFCSGTHFGDAVSLAAADAVLDLFNQKSLIQLWNTGSALVEGLRGQGWKVLGWPPRSLMQFDTMAERLCFVLGMAGQGVLMNRPNFPNMGHTEQDVKYTLQVAQVLRNVYLADWKGKEDEPEVQAWVKERQPWILFSGR